MAISKGGVDIRGIKQKSGPIRNRYEQQMDEEGTCKIDGSQHGDKRKLHSSGNRPSKPTALL